MGGVRRGEDERGRFRRTRELFLEVAGLPPKEATALLRRRAGEDAQLVLDVLELLEIDQTGEANVRIGDIVRAWRRSARAATPRPPEGRDVASPPRESEEVL